MQCQALALVNNVLSTSLPSHLSCFQHQMQMPSSVIITFQSLLLLLQCEAGQADGLLQCPGQGLAPGLRQRQGQQSTEQPRHVEHGHGRPGQAGEGRQGPDIRREDGAKPGHNNNIRTLEIYS